ncbi:MAG TPA: hypothetical protein VGC80_17875 [Acetobacteraceae bacterium]
MLAWPKPQAEAALVSNGRLSIGAFEMTAVVPRDQRPLPWLTGDLAEMVPRLVVPRLAAVLASELPEGDGGVWLIRELTIDLAVASRWSADQIAERIAAAIIAAIQRAVRGPADPGVVRLRDRAEHVASVLQDVLTGGGAHWQHGGWASAAARPRAEAVAALLREAGDDGPLALIRLGGIMAARVVDVLDGQAAADLARAWGLIGPPTWSRPHGPAGAAVQAALRRLPVTMIADRPRAALLLCALAGEAVAEAEFPALAAAVCSVLRDTGSRAGPRVILAGDATGEAVRNPIEAPGDPVVDRDRPSVARGRQRPAAESFASLTANAALFMLWRSAIESSALTHAAGLAGNAAAGAAALARTLVDGGNDPLLDPAVQCLLRIANEDVPGVSDPPPLADLLAAMAEDGWRKPAVASAVLEVVTVPVDVAPGGQVTVLADAATGSWIWLWPNGVPDPEDLLGHLGSGVPLLLDGVVAEALGADWPSAVADEGRVWLLAPGAGVPASRPPLQHQPGRLSRDLAAVCRAGSSAPCTGPALVSGFSVTWHGGCRGLAMPARTGCVPTSCRGWRPRSCRRRPTGTN